MADKNRGNRPKASRGAYAVPVAPVNHDDESPKFCLHFPGRTVPGGALDGPVGHPVGAQARRCPARQRYRAMGAVAACLRTRGSARSPSPRRVVLLLPSLQRLGARPRVPGQRHHRPLRRLHRRQRGKPQFPVPQARGAPPSSTRRSPARAPGTSPAPRSPAASARS